MTEPRGMHGADPALFLEAWTFGVKEKVDYYALDAAHMMEIVAPQEEKPSRVSLMYDMKTQSKPR